MRISSADFFAVRASLRRRLRRPPTRRSSVLACEPEWGALAQELGGDKVKCLRRDDRAAGSASDRGEAEPDRTRAERGSRRLHRRGTRNRLAAGAAAAGGQRGRAAGQPGYFEAAAFVNILDVPTRLDRADGDVHAAGNPHIQTDPRNIVPIAQAAGGAPGRSSIPPTQRSTRRGTRISPTRWNAASRTLGGAGGAVARRRRSWSSTRRFTYLHAMARASREVATLEPKPGVEPTTGSADGGAGAACSRSRRRWSCAPPTTTTAASQWLAQRAKIADRRAAVHRRRRRQGAKDLFGLFDDTHRAALRKGPDADEHLRARHLDPAARIRRRPAGARDARAAGHRRCSRAASCSSTSRSRRSRARRDRGRCGSGWSRRAGQCRSPRSPRRSPARCC